MWHFNSDLENQFEAGMQRSNGRSTTVPFGFCADTTFMGVEP